MTSSRRVIKSSYAIEDLEESVIQTTYDLTSTLTDASDNTEADRSTAAVSEQDQLLSNSEQQAVEILEKAAKEAQELRAQAEELGYANGEKQGFEQGYQQGFTEGAQKAQTEFQAQETHLREMVLKANEQINGFKEEVKDDLLNLAIQIAEKITHQKVDASELGVLGIARPYFFQLDKDEEIVILTVHPEAEEKVHTNLHKVETLVPESRVIVLSNPSLEENGLVVETSKGVVDFQIKQQLENILKEFVEKERTIDG